MITDPATADGWQLIGGTWEHPDTSFAYDAADWVYLGDGRWDDRYLASLNPAERLHAEATYACVRATAAQPLR